MDSQDLNEVVRNRNAQTPSVDAALHQAEWVCVLVPVEGQELYHVEIEQAVERCVEKVAQWNLVNYHLSKVVS